MNFLNPAIIRHILLFIKPTVFLCARRCQSQRFFILICLFYFVKRLVKSGRGEFCTTWCDIYCKLSTQSFVRSRSIPSCVTVYSTNCTIRPSCTWYVYGFLYLGAKPKWSTMYFIAVVNSRGAFPQRIVRGEWFLWVARVFRSRSDAYSKIIRCCNKPPMQL